MFKNSQVRNQKSEVAQSSELAAQSFPWVKAQSSKLLTTIKDIGTLIKFKLSMTVVFSAVMAYLIALKTPLDYVQLLILTLGGIFTTGAASALNQAIEKDYDKLMSRTANRPVAAGRMTPSEAVLVAGLSSLLGVSFLAYFNPITGILGMISLILYAFIYTPLKRVSNISVTVGAIPGALPVVIGCTAANNGSLTILALGLFGLQFFWQFAHFWAIAWLADEDYKKAGFFLLPSKNGEKNSTVGIYCAIYTAAIFPFIGLLYFSDNISGLTSLLLALVTLAYLYFCVKLAKTFDRKTALQLMFAALLYLPIVLGIILINKFLFS